MSREILTVVETVSNEKGLNPEDIFEAIEEALVVSTKKRVYTEQPEVAVRVEIDRDTGDYDTYRYWTVVADEDHEMPACQLAISDLDENEWSIGDIKEEQIESIEFGRIAATQAKQVIIQKIREAERALTADAFEPRIGEMMYGEVKKQTRDGYIIDLGDNAEGYLSRDQMLPREQLRVKSRINAILYHVNRDNRGAQLLLSRTSPDMLIALMNKEVPEISEQIIEIRDVARQPGVRAKISVKTNDHRIDPVGACIGMRGTRIQAVQSELDGERIDVIVWSDDPAQYIISALEPADVSSIILDEDAKTADIIFTANDQLARAIGAQGQNVRLASELTGYKLNMMLEAEYLERQQNETKAYLELFYNRLEVDEDLAQALVDVGFTSIEEVAYVPVETFYDIEGLDDDAIEMIQERAKEVVIADELVKQQNMKEPSKELLTMDGMTTDWAYKLAQRDIITLDDLAEQAVFDLEDIEGLDEKTAGELIMKARESWFNEE
ncbi:transcription termination factor NusA [Psychrobacter sanguinis]|uniref:transcription termination factor NusA n=1 Tax=Psychrobacter sanguinis TaxID=861445 RepID=UPI00020C7A54|nr:transcription termination factor NusA [Psychrobacter sanguinis]EGK13538.1 N utilization substance A [Psychrobacter sp. 1501(2011)]MCC3308889.1 transcription termination factor NusA [Psychrobacter sanguinis]MCC3345873.1 transcription termination factor NusA [Psychrobacter sanguinis]MCD9150403.1 transcription termination factor NusA [Psychrobacter sanguinis]MDY3307477.1 transcription termination factor NusA [Psychrobacter sanguinis]